MADLFVVGQDTGDLVGLALAGQLRFTPARGTFADRARTVARQVADVTGHEPVALDLSAPDCPVHAVQVVCPGTQSRIRRAMPR